jgi:hypothetical protein
MCVGSSSSRDLDESLTDANFGCRSLEIEIRRGENIEAGAFSFTSRNSGHGIAYTALILFSISDIASSINKL